MYPAHKSSERSADLVRCTWILIQDYDTEMWQYQVLKHESQAMRERAGELRVRSRQARECSQRLDETYLTLRAKLGYLSMPVQTYFKEFEQVGDDRYDRLP